MSEVTTKLNSGTGVGEGEAVNVCVGCGVGEGMAVRDGAWVGVKVASGDDISCRAGSSPFGVQAARVETSKKREKKRFIRVSL